jgi:type I site-specific restriction endonuclease
LINYKNYPASLMANEAGIKLNSLTRRCDTVVYNNQLEPLMIIEYKESKVQITQNVFDQVVRYNTVLKVPYIVVSNGISHYCCRMNYEDQSFEYLTDIPEYQSLR